MANIDRSWSAIDVSFDPVLTTSYYLSIRVALDGLSFCTVDPVRNQFIQFKNRPFVWDGSNWEVLFDALDQEELMTYSYQKVVVVVDNRFSLLVPSTLLRPDRKREMLAFAFHGNFDDYAVYENRVRMVDGFNLFAVPGPIVKKFEALFGDPVFIHVTTPLLEMNQVLDASRYDSIALRLHFGAGWFYVMVVENRNLKLFNCFEAASVKEVLYYLLFVVEQCRLNARELEVWLSGNISMDSEYCLSLKSYFKKIRFETPGRHAGFSAALRDVEFSWHYPLFNSVLCV